MTRRLLPLLLSLLLLYGCAEPGMTPRDQYYLQHFRAEWRLAPPPVAERDIVYSVVMNSPEKLAAEAAEKGDFRLAAVAMGLHATAKNAHIVAVTCAKPLETQTVVYGCVPPPSAFFKLLGRYNRALIAHEKFPDTAGCSADPAFDESMQKWDAQLADEEIKRAQRQLNK
jgi:hypothetical protein